ncbi:hypothetical protein [Cupriavidus sp. TMH.W2]|uniref:hypothetical protein n=1 Tax=Cupriavidus sp. TMH.W2 TaxID=3434465 RepID=UPI003D780356
MELEDFRVLLSELRLAPESVSTAPADALFPDVPIFEVDLDLDNRTFNVGDLMKLPSVSSSSHVIEIPDEIMLQGHPCFFVAWKVRLKTGQTLIMSLKTEPVLELGGVRRASGKVYVVADELFVTFVEEIVVERLRTFLTNRTIQQIVELEKNIELLLDGVNPARAAYIAGELKGLFLAGQNSHAAEPISERI